MRERESAGVRFEEVRAYQWGCQAVWAGDEVPAEAALDAEKLAVDRRFTEALGILDGPVQDAVLHGAAHATVATDGTLALAGRVRTKAKPGHWRESGGRADLDTASAEDAARIDQWKLEGRRNL